MSIKHDVKKFVLTNFLFTEDESALTDGASLVRSGIIDSTGILELIMHIEETFSIKVQPDEMVPDNFDSVDLVAQFVARRLNHA